MNEIQKPIQREALYDKAASSLRKWLNLLSRSLLYERVGYLKHFRDNIDFQDGQVWVDLGAGFLQKTSKTVKNFPNIEVLAMDESVNMLKKGIEEYPDFQGKVFSGDIGKLPIPGDKIDGVFIFQVSHHLDNGKLEKSIQEIKRVLKSGGQVAVIETFNIDSPGIKKKLFEIIEGEYVALSNQSLQINDEVYSNTSKDSLVKLFEENGFEFANKQSRGLIKIIDNARYFISEPLVFRLKENK